MLNGDEVPDEVNDTFIVLIPKVQNPWAPKIESLSPVMTRGLAIST